MVEYLVTYSKFVTCKKEGTVLQGVYFAGIEQTREAADKLGKDCVNVVKGGTIVAKVTMVKSPYNVLEKMYDIIDLQERQLAELLETEKTFKRKK